MAVVFGRGCGNDLVGGEFFVGGVSQGDQTCDRGQYGPEAGLA